ncbi:TIGR02611 family protein [Calidifontibacter sp. DB0510]|uniref:TIGR02611 family protein n=2 Tax=Metallococcus carri TaxID=1656884 RepID=A0A967B191_9MICO|nr:TIGR02611 family protein [Metallococcus carri]NOP37691.1 TIGR02611 family protein [Calidifontibacter sp. DB2511S]
MPDHTQDQSQERESLRPTSHRWAWRRKLHGHFLPNQIYRIGVAIVGAAVTIGGLIAVPAPGPGWLIVFVGLGILATEFVWAARLLRWGRGKLHAWNMWLKRQPWWVTGLVGLGTFALVLGIFWVMLSLTGVPGFAPEPVAGWLDAVPGIDR